MNERTKKLTLTIFSIILGALFLVDGLVKFAGITLPFRLIPIEVYPVRFLYVVGLVEILGGVALLIPRIRFYGAVIAFFGMVSVLISAMVISDIALAVIPFIGMIYSWMIGWLTMPDGVLRIACTIPGLKMTHTCRVGHH